MTTHTDKASIPSQDARHTRTRIFLSYSRKDQAFAWRLAQALSSAALDVWIDIDDIPAGQKWSTAIQEGLMTSAALIVVLSPAAMASRHVEDEWQYFLDRGKPVIPVLLTPTDVHFELSRLQYVSFYRQKFNVALLQLLTELRRLNLHVSVADYLQETRLRKPSPSPPASSSAGRPLPLPPSQAAPAPAKPPPAALPLPQVPQVQLPQTPALVVANTTVPTVPTRSSGDRGGAQPWLMLWLATLALAVAGWVMAAGGVFTSEESAPAGAPLTEYLIASNPLSNVNVRQWDSEQAPVVHVLRRGQEARIYGVNVSATWLYATMLPSGKSGWIKAEAVQVTGDYNRLPTVTFPAHVP